MARRAENRTITVTSSRNAGPDRASGAYLRVRPLDIKICPMVLVGQI